VLLPLKRLAGALGSRPSWGAGRVAAAPASRMATPRPSLVPTRFGMKVPQVSCAVAMCEDFADSAVRGTHRGYGFLP
jgi:hypothetical protein